MVDITHKNNTLRTAVAQAIVKVSSPKTIEAIITKQIPKGDVFEMAKTAGLFAAKRTSDMIPDCHPLPIEFTSVDYKIENLNIQIIVTIKTLYKTGVEVEAMHAASVVAITMYDMLKPVDKGVEIENIKLIHKKGGKSSFKDNGKGLKSAVVVCSNAIANEQKEDKAGKIVIEKLESLEVSITEYSIIPDNFGTIQEKVKHLENQQNDLIIFTGGTGLSKTDITPQALIPLLDYRIPGIEEAIRSYGQNRMPYAMISRSVVGVINKSIIIALPGSTNGAKESMDAIFPAVLHAFKALKA